MQWEATELRRRRKSEEIRSDVLTGGVVAAAILMFIGTGSEVVSSALRAVKGLGNGPDQALLVALTLNILLILFGWWRFNKLKRQLHERTLDAEEARRLADTDPLTGLLNRRALLVRGQRMLSDAVAADLTVAMMLLDLDHFKSFNDAHGHAGGDHILKNIARKLAAALPDNAIKARLGGDEFIAMLPIKRGASAAVDAIAGELLSNLHSQLDLKGEKVQIGASMGLALASDSSVNMDALVRQADIAMYHCKENGRNRHIWFESGMEMATDTRNKWEAAIWSGMERGEFRPHFEPQVELTTGRIMGFEMLMRWDSAEHGQVPPERFIPLAEEAGVISDLSLLVVREAMLIARLWASHIMLSINISPLQLKDPWFSQKLTKLIVETGFPANQLEVEVTEMALIEDKPLVQSIIASLKNQGVRLTLDNFGTGYASLSHLRTLPFDRIKIDRSFIAAMALSPDAKAIVMAVLRLGESLSTAIVAKGVEDAETAKALIELGCKQAQGWFFGRATAPEDMHQMLAEKGLLRDPRAAVPHHLYLKAAAKPAPDSDLQKTG